MQFDVLLEGGTIIDGSGRPGFAGSVGIDGDTIRAVGDLADAEAAVRIDCSSLAVSPGFIDIHTHYDAPVLWDRDLTPSSWYGVTTVLFGNCSFSIAPSRNDTESHRIAAGILETAEGMSRDVLDAGISWEFETFDEYLDCLRQRRTALNVGALVGHSMLRVYSMGPAAFDRPASDQERESMGGELARALEAGAFGFSTARSGHVAFGRPIPSRIADKDEMWGLVGVLAEVGAGITQVIGGPDLDVADFARMAKVSSRPVTWSPLRTRPRTQKHWAQLAATERYQANGVRLWPQVGCEPVGVELSFAEPLMFEAIPGFAKLNGVSVDVRRAALGDARWRRTIERELLENELMDCAFERIVIQTSTSTPELRGRVISELAEEQRTNPFDVMAELALADDLQTRFTAYILDYDDDEVGRLLERSSVLVGLSDAGAHQGQLCDAGFACRLLSHWVRDRHQFPIEEAVWKLTGQPADAFGIRDRGRLSAGAKADVCVFNPTTVGEGELLRSYDLPAGGERLVREAIGVEHVLVNGQFIRRNGAAVAAHPGTVLAPTS
jgi:N-acyl-D-aspartate/D-glutamate deacylase